MKTIMPFIIIFICVGMYYFYIKPTSDEIKSLSLNKTEYNNILTKSKELTSTRDKVLEDYNSISEGDKTRLSKVIPETFDPVLFANDINVRAAQYGMTVKDFKQNDPKSETRDTIINQAQDAPYKITVVTFQVTGQYSQFLKFLNDLESSLRLMDVTGLVVRPANIRSLADTSLDYLLEISTYSLR